ncbi:MAG: PpiC-type peptidyl-prolyl cis-trans isomerase [Marmoricola sp.]|nr:PpiC-type peptidyl-prolyl cis-trans isomerase [Marmoricola sp.]
MNRPQLNIAPASRSLRWAVGLVALVVVGLSGWNVASARADLPADAVLRYDGHIVTKAQLAARVKVLTALYGVQPPASGAKLDQFERQAAKSYAVGLILSEEAARRNIVVADKQASDQLDKLIADQLQGGRQAFVQFLQTSGISQGDVLDEIKRQMATAKIVEQVTANLPAVSDAQVSAFYTKNQTKMVTDPTRTLSDIVVADAGEATQIAALARKKGADFGALAKKYSADGSTKGKGGSLGAVAQADLEAGFGKAAFAAADGAVFGPVQTQYGWNVGKVDAIAAAQPLSLADVTSALRTELENKARLTKWQDFLGKLLASANVEYAKDFLPGDPKAAPSDLPSGGSK